MRKSDTLVVLNIKTLNTHVFRLDHIEEICKSKWDGEFYNLQIKLKTGPMVFIPVSRTFEEGQIIWAGAKGALVKYRSDRPGSSKIQSNPNRYIRIDHPKEDTFTFIDLEAITIAGVLNLDNSICHPCKKHSGCGYHLIIEGRNGEPIIRMWFGNEKERAEAECIRIMNAASVWAMHKIKCIDQKNNESDN